jgi:hypothetical protein
MGRVVNIKPRPLYTQEKAMVHILQEVGWAPKQVWKGVKRISFASKDSKLK